MKKLHTTLRLALLFIMLAAAIVSLHSCSDDDEKPKTLPEVTTAAITEFTTTTALGGGTIVSNGNAAVTASGLVYSSTNTMPTTADEKTTLTTASGSFTSELTNLTSGTPYHVRAYATNSVGTAYGNVVTFTTGNAAPTVTNITITGDVEVNKELTASYTYADPEGDAESGTTIQWYIADTDGGAETAIEGATETTYTPPDALEFKYIRVGITPKAATGTTTGAQVKSAFKGPIAVRTTITFTYNNEEVTYGIIPSPVTGRKWLDRNLGAPNTPSSYDDFANYGDLFQWGRGDDGHQLVNRAATTAATTGTATTTELSLTNSPGHALFILSSADFNFDWINPQNDNLWQGVDGINNPCPTGFRIPTNDEWLAENLTVQEAYTQLKLTLGGQRNTTGGFSTVAGLGSYWTSSISSTSPTRALYYTLDWVTETTENSFSTRVGGKMCRCIKD